MTLTGDLHHYCRFEAEDDSQLITAGGGGAYLFPTHTMPAALTLPDEPQLYEQAGCWPSARTLRAVGARSLAHAIAGAGASVR